MAIWQYGNMAIWQYMAIYGNIWQYGNDQKSITMTTFIYDPPVRVRLPQQIIWQYDDMETWQYGNMAL